MRTSHREIPNDLHGYLPDGYVICGIYLPEDHGWTAIAVEFDVAGSGPTVEEAIRDSLVGVHDYLRLCRDDGYSFEESIRPADEEVRQMYADALSEELSRFKRGDRLTEEKQPQSFKTPALVC